MGIKLTRKETKFMHKQHCRHAWSMEVTAESDLPDLDSNIFVYHAVEPEDPEASDSFSNVASLQDMNMLPVDAPAELQEEEPYENFVPYYRKNSVVLDFYNTKDLERAWRIMCVDVSSLTREYYAARRMQQGEVVEFNDRTIRITTVREQFREDAAATEELVDKINTMLINDETNTLKGIIANLQEARKGIILKSDLYQVLTSVEKNLSTDDAGELRSLVEDMKALAQREDMPDKVKRAYELSYSTIEDVATIIETRSKTTSAISRLAMTSHHVDCMDKDASISPNLERRIKRELNTYFEAVDKETALLQALSMHQPYIEKLIATKDTLLNDVNKILS